VPVPFSFLKWNNASVGKYFRIFFTATMLSRGFGYLRDLSIAHFVGGGYWADLYFASFRLANIFRRLIGEGGLYAAYTPIYAAILAKDPDSAKQFAHAYAGRLLIALVVLIGLGMLFIRPLTGFFLMGFTMDPIQMDWAVRLTAVLLPFLAFVAMAAWAQATLQAHGKYFLSSLAPAATSITIILFLVMFESRSVLDPMPELILGLAFATTLGGLLQYTVLMPQTIMTIGFGGIKSLWAPHPELKKSFVLFLPYVFTFSIDSVNSFLDTFFGAFAGPGAIAALYNSSRLIQLPLGLVGVGSLVATLPTFSKLASQADKTKLLAGLKKQRKIVLMLCIPAMLIFMIGAPWIIKLLYFHGKFDAHAWQLTSSVLRAASPSLLFYSLQKLYLSVFYANQGTKSPMMVSAAQLVIMAAGSLALMPSLGAVGIALAGSAASLVGFVSMLVIIRKKGFLA